MNIKRCAKKAVVASVILMIAVFLFRTYKNDKNKFRDKTWHRPSSMASYRNTSESASSLPILLWWDSVYTSVDETRTCGKSACRVTNNRDLKYHPNTTVFIFYGSHFTPFNLPFPRRRQHLWALMHEESPRNAYILSHGDTMSLFNFTSSYNTHSDYPITTQWLQCADWIHDKKYMLPLVDKNRLRKAGLAPVLYIHSDCDVPSDRDSFVKMLQNFIPVDSYGSCVNNRKMPDRLRFRKDMSALEDPLFYQFAARYKFTLSIENYICDDYVTEKLWRPLRLGSVPIVFGAPNVREYLPSNKSAILVEDFQDVEDLANYIKLLDSSNKLYKQYLAFKDEPIKNKNLVNILSTRDWRPESCDKKSPRQKKMVSKHNKHNSIFTGFECFLCNKLTEMGKAQFGQLDTQNAHNKDKELDDIYRTYTESDTHRSKLGKAIRSNGEFVGNSENIYVAENGKTSYVADNGRTSYVADSTHYQCPSPLRFDEDGQYILHDSRWASDWRHGGFEAAALEVLYQEQRTASLKEFNALVKQQIKEDRPD